MHTRLGLFSLTIDLCDTIPALAFANLSVRRCRRLCRARTICQPDPHHCFQRTQPRSPSQPSSLPNTTNNYVDGCVQATLSNGKTTYQPAAKYAVLGVFPTRCRQLPHSHIARASLGAAQWRVVDVFTTIQHISLSALLALDYPQVFTEFARNFAWSIGLINIPAVQRSILSTREKTGGTKDGIFGSLLTAETGKQFNPFTTLASPGCFLGFDHAAAFLFAPSP